MPVKQGNSGMAVASLVCSLVGVIPCFWLFQIMGLLGTIFGFVGLKQTKDGQRGGRGLALAGVIIGIILVVASVIFWVYVATNANCLRVGNRFDCTTK
jgi:glucose uptake protein GlcU